MPTCPFIIYTGYGDVEGPCNKGVLVRKPATAIMAALLAMVASG